MSNRALKKLLILGALAIMGVIFIQAYWVLNTWYLRDEGFDSSVRISLRNTAESLAQFNSSSLPKQNIIQRRSSNTYVVNINDEIDAQVLEDYLIRNFERYSINADFEYGIYDCGSGEMLYGNYCDIGSRGNEKSSEIKLPKFKDLEYYFVVRFPGRVGYILSNMRQAMWFTIIALLAISFFIYTIVLVLRQRRYTEMQRDFINNMTHEFKTPIASVKLAAGSIAKDEYVQQNPRLTKFVEIIDEQSSRLNNQVERLLNVAALEKQNLDLQYEDINLSQLIEEIVEDVRMRVRSKGGKLDFINSTEHIVVQADRIHLTNVIYSLVDNAIKYSDQAPEIKLVLDEKTLEISDRGIGIDEANLKLVFKKFYRVPTGNIHNVKGFGLGLYYVKTIINKLKWSISVDSTINEGTTFTIKFAK